MSIKEDIEKVENKIEEIERNSFALELLKDYKKQNKRLFIIILVVLTFWLITIGYLIYVLNDVGVVETTVAQEVTQENEEGYNNFIGNDGEIINGKANN